MRWIDVEGVEHPSSTDETSDWGDKHILGCARCQEMFPTVAFLLRMGAA